MVAVVADNLVEAVVVFVMVLALFVNAHPVRTKKIVGGKDKEKGKTEVRQMVNPPSYSESVPDSSSAAPHILASVFPRFPSSFSLLLSLFLSLLLSLLFHLSF